jgi:DNA-directed RNA polymerase specialized sigma subunit
MDSTPIFKSRAMLRVERRIGRSLEEFLAERYLVANQTQIAAELGVSNATVSRWMSELGIEARFPGQRPPTEAVT